MQLYKEILCELLSKETVTVSFSGLKASANELVEMTCYQALKRIRSILADSSLSDSECFVKIEEIVCLLEELGSDGGSRHDFG
ncbi:MAG: hypothetical protein IKM08_08090 [Clostridia bacterium]|nr:hypothetical protein [Clostridia bacterium]